jgi:hypothetical protein
MVKLGLVALTIAMESSTAAADEQLMSCADRDVTYSNPGAVPLKDRVIVTKLSGRPKSVLNETDRALKASSPQGIAAFNRVRIADTTKSGPRHNSIQLFTVSGPLYAWQIDLRDIRDNASLEWLNEDLIFIRVWWGRIVSTDLIFQLSTGTFIYAQEANYGALIQPCKRSN